MDQSESTPGAAGEGAQSTAGVRGAAQTAFKRTREAARDTVQRNARKAADSVGGAANAVRRAAADIETDNSLVAGLLRSSADGLEKASKAISEGDLSRSLDQIGAFARREPGLFLVASFAVGFALARIGKSAMEEGDVGASGENLYDTTNYDETNRGDFIVSAP